MRENCTYGSARGAPGDRRLYRDPEYPAVYRLVEIGPKMHKEACLKASAYPQGLEPVGLAQPGNPLHFISSFIEYADVRA